MVHLDKDCTVVVMGGPPDIGTDLDHHDPPPEGAGRIHGNWAGGGDLEDDQHHHKSPPQEGHLPL